MISTAHGEHALRAFNRYAVFEDMRSAPAHATVPALARCAAVDAGAQGGERAPSVAT